MRILGGTGRGRTISGSPGLNLRPTPGKVKEALFSILAPHLSGARFLDLFAGTGMVGMEALSRGARHVTFVDSHPMSCRRLRENLRRLGYAKHADVRCVTASRFLKHAPHEPYDLVFLDPPYDTGEGGEILPFLERDVIIRSNGVVVIEHFHKTRLQERVGGLALLKSYRYGDTLLSLYQFADMDMQAS